MKTDAQPAQWRIKTPEDFRWEPNLGYLSRSPDECLYDVGGDAVTRCIPVPACGERPIVTIRPGGDGRSLLLAADGVTPARMSAVREAVTRYVADWFDLDTDLAPFYEAAERDPLLGESVRRFRGLRLIGVPDLYEALAWAILGQQITLSFAYTLKRRFVEAYGGTARGGDGRTYRTFPAPETVADLRRDDLTALRMTARKAEYLIDTARLVADGSLAKSALLASAAGASRAAEQSLTRIRGIGPWTAHYVAMRCLRLTDALPVQDVGLQLAIQRQLGWDRKPRHAEIRAFAEGWHPWEAYAVFYLWRTLY